MSSTLNNNARAALAAHHPAVSMTQQAIPPSQQQQNSRNAIINKTQLANVANECSPPSTDRMCWCWCLYVCVSVCVGVRAPHVCVPACFVYTRCTIYTHFWLIVHHAMALPIWLGLRLGLGPPFYCKNQMVFNYLCLFYANVLCADIKKSLMATNERQNAMQKIYRMAWLLPHNHHWYMSKSILLQAMFS